MYLLCEGVFKCMRVCVLGDDMKLLFMSMFVAGIYMCAYIYVCV